MPDCVYFLSYSVKCVVLSFRLTKQTNKNVADTIFNSFTFPRITSKFLSTHGNLYKTRFIFFSSSLQHSVREFLQDQLLFFSAALCLRTNLIDFPNQQVTVKVSSFNKNRFCFSWKLKTPLQTPLLPLLVKT